MAEKSSLRSAERDGGIDQISALINRLDANDWKGSGSAQPHSASHREIVLNDNIPKGQADPSLPSVVVIDKTHHLTHVLQIQKNKLEDVLTVRDTVGKPSTPTPDGRMVVSDKRLDPIWTPPKSIDPLQRPIAPYKITHHNPIGVAFIRLNGSTIGMHGTNRPDEIGKSVSHGCIRHNNADILKIYPLVQKGTPVYIEQQFHGTVIRAEDFQRR